MKQKKNFILFLFLFFSTPWIHSQYSWSEYADISWYDRDIPEFIITTPRQLAGLAQLVNTGTDFFENKTVRLGANIFLNDTVGWSERIRKYTKGSSSEDFMQWKPIGNTSKYVFKGTFDGCGYVIAGMFISLGNNYINNYAGLFGYVKEGSIKNIHINSSFLGSVAYNSVQDSDVGTLAGCIESSIIENCSSSTMIMVRMSVNGYSCGGLIGYAKSSLMKNCIVTGNISTNYTNVGGLVGYTELSSKIIDCSVSGEISSSSATYVGGLVGYAKLSLSVLNCSVLSELSQNNTNTNTNTITYTGGLIGATAQSGKGGDTLIVMNSYVSGKIKGAIYTGGLIGYLDMANRSYITESYSLGNISSSYSISSFLYPTPSFVYVGGLIGYTRGKTEITNCYSAGNISSSFYNFYNEKKSSVNLKTGGLIGYAGNTTIANCYTTGNVSSSSSSIAKNNASLKTGGLIGEGVQYITITNCATFGKISSSSSSSSFSFSYSPLGTTLYSGGLIGGMLHSNVSKSNLSITNSSVLGTVSCSSSYEDEDHPDIYIGGMIGYADAILTIKNSYVLANIEYSCYMPYIGGVIGYVPNNTITLWNTYTASKISSSLPFDKNKTGLLIGKTISSITVGKTYYDSTINHSSINAIGGRSTVNNITGKSSAEMQSDTFVKLLNEGVIDNNTIFFSWKQRANKQNGYPYHVLPILPMGISVNKIYDGTISAKLNTDNLILFRVREEDTVSLVSSNITASFLDKEAGRCKPITLTGNFEIVNTHADDYVLTQPVLTGNILPKSLIVKSEDTSKITGEADPLFSVTYNGFIYGEDEYTENLIPKFTRELGENIGKYKIIPWGLTSNNYDIHTRYGYLSILKENNITSFTKEQFLTLFPNPAEDYFCLEGILQPSKIDIYHTNGKLLLQKEVNPNENIYIGNLAKGIYIVKVNDFILKLIKK